jgi:hypothetical protein
MYTNWDLTVMVKIISTSSLEYRMARRLLGEQAWPEARRSRLATPDGSGAAVTRLWETLHFVPLAPGVDGLVHVAEYPEVAALAMRRLVPLRRIATFTNSDMLALVHVVAMVGQVRHLQEPLSHAPNHALLLLIWR